MKTVDSVIESLKEINENVTDGEWWMDSHGEELVSFGSNSDTRTILRPEHLREKAHRDEVTGGLSYWPNDSDASWIVAAQPKNIMMLIDEISRLKQENEQLRSNNTN